MYYEKLLDDILDRMNKKGIEYITDTEKIFLEKYNSAEDVIELYDNITNLKNYYYNMFQYDPRNDNDNFIDFGMSFTKWTDEEITEGKYSILWDNIDVEYMDLYMKIYKVPFKYHDHRWDFLPTRIKITFKDFLFDEFDIN